MIWIQSYVTKETEIIVADPVQEIISERLKRNVGQFGTNAITESCQAYANIKTVETLYRLKYEGGDWDVKNEKLLPQK